MKVLRGLLGSPFVILAFIIAFGAIVLGTFAEVMRQISIKISGIEWGNSKFSKIKGHKKTIY